MSIAAIPEALDALRAGRPVIVADNESRENEGDVILAAEFASQEWIAWTVRNSSGFLCAPMTNETADRLNLPVMVVDNEDALGTNYTVSVDAADRLSTGISAGTAPTHCVFSPIPNRRRPACTGRATSSRCVRQTAACANVPATPRPRSTCSSSPASSRSA